MQATFQEAGVNLKQAFLAFDDNDDGYISGSEFRRGVMRPSREGLSSLSNECFLLSLKQSLSSLS